MNDEVTMSVEDILKLDDDSITDAETVRQIGLITTNPSANISDEEFNSLVNKVKKNYQVCGLYPNTMKIYNI